MAGKGDLAKLRKRQMEIMRENRLNMDAEARQFSQIVDIVGKNAPDDRSIFGSVYRAALLSGPRTHTGNLVSNTVQNALNATTDRLASGIDLARSKITGKEREVVGSAGGRQGIADAYYNTFANESETLPAKHGNVAMASGAANVLANGEKHPAMSVVGKGTGTVLTVTPQSDSQMQRMRQQKSDLLNGSSDGGTSSSSQQATPEAGFPYPGRQATNPSIPQKSKVVNPEQQEKFDNLRDILAKRREAENAPARFETDAERNKKFDKAIERYYNKYGDDFEEKMPSALQDRYNELLDKAQRDKNGVYTDPITGGRSIDTVVKGGAPDGRDLVVNGRQVLDGNNPLDWEKQTQDYINQKIRKNKDTNITGNDGTEYILTEDTAGKAKYRNKVRTPNGGERYMNNDEFAAKLRAESHIDEITKTARPKYNGKVFAGTKSHEFDKDGFMYGKSYYQDSDGNYTKHGVDR